MAQKLNLSYDENLVAELSNKFDLRDPNAEALADLVKRIEKGNYDALEPLVLNLATGAGKTYVMAAFIEYLRRQGHPNVMVVTPTKVVQDKTVLDFTEGSHRYIGGFDVPPRLVTPGDVSNLRVDNVASDLFVGEGASTLYVFNVQQLFPPKDGGKNVATGDEAARRKTWKFQEDSGALAQRLIDTEDLVIIADESHLFGSTAKTFRKSLTSLKPAVTVGLTASPDKGDDIVYHYPLWRAIQDGYVKQPVLVYRESGYASEAPAPRRFVAVGYQGGGVRELQPHTRTASRPNRCCSWSALTCGMPPRSPSACATRLRWRPACGAPGGQRAQQQRHPVLFALPRHGQFPGSGDRLGQQAARRLGHETHCGDVYASHNGL